jgi:hypothetical protein
MKRRIKKLLEEQGLSKASVNTLTKGEGFKIDSAGGELSLEATLEYIVDGVYQLSDSIKMGQIAEMDGAHIPKYFLRPIWFKKGVKVDANKIRRLGYNAVISEEKIDGVETLLRTRDDFSKDVNYIFWESDFADWHPRKHDKDALLYDTILAEVKDLEEKIGNKKLIYFMPYSQKYSAESQVQWLLDLCDDVGESTILSFPVVAGDPENDYLEAHPLWAALRSKKLVASTSFLPVVNVVGQGDGLWPVLTFDGVEECFSRMYRHNFIGAVAVAAYMPSEGALADCNLWVAGHRMWENIPASLLVESWFRGYLSKWDFCKYRELFRDIRKMAQKMSVVGEGIGEDEAKLELESLFAKLKQWSFVEGEIEGYLRYFIRDAKRILLHYVQEKKIPFHTVLTGDDLEPGFWSQAEGGRGGGSTMVELFESPQVDSEEEAMVCIYSNATNIR